MAKKVKIGIKVPTSSELNRRYGNLLINPSTQERPKLWLPSRFLALNYQYGGGIPFGKILEVMGQESSGKAVPLDSPVLTPTGYKLMGELSLSDKVMDPVSGDPISIIGIYPQGLKRVYKVTFRDGTSAECSEDHLWEVQFRSHNQYKSQVLTLKEILEKGYRTKRASGKGKFKYKYNIPSTIPLNFEKKELPIHPYILGYILGDGGLGRANYIMFNIGLEDADSFKHNISKFLKEGAELEDKGIYENPFGKTHRFILKGYSKEIRSLCLEGKLSSDKFIPEDYLWSSVEDRKYLLSGLLDSDGTIGEQHNRAKYSSRFKFSSTSSKMIKQLVQVVRSLGGFITEPKSKIRERQFEGYEKRISKEIRTGGRLPFNPFMLERKRKQYQVKIESQTKSANYRRSIIDISYVGKKECQCIKVSSERGLFMLNDFIVTHNTLVAYDFAYCTQQLGGVVLLADAEQAFTNKWAEQNGLDLDRVLILRETSVEVISDWIAQYSLYWRSILTHNEPILVIIDSLASLDTSENINSQMTDSKADMGNRAKAIYKMFRIRSELLSKLGVTMICINQLRKNLKAGMFQNPDTTPGGQAMKFYASIRSGFYGSKTITEKHKGKEVKVGRYTSIRMEKNKIAPSRATISKAPMYYNPKYHDVGFDRYFGLGDILVEEEVLEKTSGGIYKYKGKTIARGDEKLQLVIEEDEKLRKRFIKACGINTITTTQKHLDDLKSKGINLFPVDGNLDYESQSDDSEDEEEEEEFED